MKYVLLVLLLLFAPEVFSHPLDDRAQMTSEVVIVSDQRLEYVLHFRYLDAIASITEIDGGLDGNKNGLITAPELKRRFNLLVDELILPITIRVDGAALALTPDFDRFLFQDLNRTGPLDLHSGVPTDTLRIHYRFVFYCDLAKPLQPGEHKVEYSFNSSLSVISAITEQMVAFDAREQSRFRISEVTHSTSGIPTMTFDWVVPAPDVVPERPPKPEPQPDQSAAREPDFVDGVMIPWYMWANLCAGVVLLLAGLCSAARAILKDRHRLSRSVVVAALGAGIVVWMLWRMRIFPL